MRYKNRYTEKVYVYYDILKYILYKEAAIIILIMYTLYVFSITDRLGRYIGMEHDRQVTRQL